MAPSAFSVASPCGQRSWREGSDGDEEKGGDGITGNGGAGKKPGVVADLRNKREFSKQVKPSQGRA
jgi:hypothetical protein